MAHQEVFAPPTEAWASMAPSFHWQLRLNALIGWLIMVAIPVAATWIFATREIALVVAGVGLLIIVWRVFRQGAIARAWGYAERETDLYIKRGIWWRNLTVVPYGRMQAVEVTAGPIQRAFGLASVQLVTASARSDAIIPGLAPEAAAQLRDRLTERGETQAAGL